MRHEARQVPSWLIFDVGQNQRRMRSSEVRMIKAVHAYAEFWEPLEANPTFVIRPMFGTKAVYLYGKIVLCFSTRKDPWHGVLVATERVHHDSLLTEFPTLSAHPILPKWLYVPDSSNRFEETVERLVQLVRNRDPRIGVIPRSKTKRPNKAPEPTPGAVTPRATKSTPK